MSFQNGKKLMNGNFSIMYAILKNNEVNFTHVIEEQIGENPPEKWKSDSIKRKNI